ncbi:MAG: isoprenyl transferase [Ignavibacteriae bacterium]|nr:isoprenyl transferase [Ignavibacteriota bacterium]
MAYKRSAKAAEVSPEALKESGPIPQHIAIIMDGNGRWAKSKGMPRAIGHREGVRSVREIVTVCGELGVKYLTLYAFSTENWRRPKDEVSTLMSLLVTSLRQEINDLHKNQIRLTTIGDLTQLPKEAQRELQDAVQRTKDNPGLTLNLALSYSGRWDVVRAIRRIAIESRSGKISPEDIDEQLVASFLSTAGIPDPDLLIRTSGEMRLSNFLLWELAYTEFFISPVYWPQFRRTELYEAVLSFQKRERRFGLVSEQLSNTPARATVQEERVNAVTRV